MEINLKAIAKITQGVIEGNSEVKISDICKIEEGKEGAIAFLANSKYEKYLYTTDASAVIVSKDLVLKEGIRPSLIRVDDPYHSFTVLLQEYARYREITKKGKEKNAYVSKKARLGKNTYVGAFAYISDGSVIGDQTKIFPQVFIGTNVKIGVNVKIHAGAKILDDTVIGNNCNIHAGAVVGSDGFGFAPSDTSYTKVPQLGNVVIEDNVEIGANVTIDRATMGSTIIKEGAKIDNLVQIAHNVEIGEHTVIAAQSGIAGSTKVGKNCMFGGQVGVIGHAKIGDRVKIGAQGGVISDIPEGKVVWGTPTIDLKQYNRSYVYFKRLPEILKSK